MVRFITELPIEEDNDNVSKVKTVKSSLDSLDLKNDFSIADSFLDFDSIKEWFEGKSIEKTKSGVLDRRMEADEEQGYEKMPTGIQIRSRLEPNFIESRTNTCESEEHVGDPNSTSLLCKPVLDVPRMKVEEEALSSDANAGFCVENEMGKVSLVDCQEISILDNSNGKSVPLSVNCENRSTCVEKSESDRSSLLSSSSDGDGDDDDDDDDDDEEEEEEDSSENKGSTADDGQKIELKMAGKTELDGLDNLEEGEIRDADEIETVYVNGDGDSNDDEEEADGEHMNFGSIELDDTDDDEAVGVPKGPIRSKNELEKLPPVPKVDVVLQPNHQILPVGVISSVIGTQIIVEGSEKHNPLNEGSILWITESKFPLGLVDEIFGPVKKPYYVVRYNSEAEAPVGVREGALVSFVPEFAGHVLNDNNLYKKGYDASGENDEEVSNDEFSDDEKEAEYKRMQKVTKRGMNEQRPGNKNNKNFQRKGAPWKNKRHHAEMRPPSTFDHPANSNRYNNQMESGNSQSSQPAMQQPSMVSGAGLVPPFPVMQQPPTGPGMWFNRMPGQAMQTPFFQSGFANGANPLHAPPNNQLHPYPMPMLMPNPMFMPFQHQQMFDPSQCTAMPFQQQQMFDPSQCNAMPFQQPNFGSSGPWTGNHAMQAGFNQSMSGMSLPAQQSTGDVQQPAVPPGSFGAPPQPFNTGSAPSARGRKTFRGGRFHRK